LRTAVEKKGRADRKDAGRRPRKTQKKKKKTAVFNKEGYKRNSLEKQRARRNFGEKRLGNRVKGDSKTATSHPAVAIVGPTLTEGRTWDPGTRKTLGR